MKPVVDGVAKNVTAGELFLVSEPSIAERRERGSVNPLLDFFRVSLRLTLAKEPEAVHPWTHMDAQLLAGSIKAKFESTLKQVDNAAFKAARSPTTTKAPAAEGSQQASAESSENLLAVAGAVDQLLHLLDYGIAVTPDREGPNKTYDFKVSVTVAVPAMKSALDPLRMVLSDETRSREHFRAIIAPLTRALEKALPPTAATVMADPATLDFLARVTKMTLSASQGKSVHRIPELVEVLALCRLSMRFNARVPSPSHSDPADAAADVAISFLKHFTAPDAWEDMPRSCAKDVAEFSFVLDNCPTLLIEQYNKIFNSHHRLPDSARQSALDGFMSPAAKVSLGLKMFSELVVEVHRPFSPQLGELSDASAAGKCTPRVALPPDIIASCAAVDKAARSAISEIESQRQRKVEDLADALSIKPDAVDFAAASEDATTAQEATKAAAEGAMTIRSILQSYQVRVDSVSSCSVQVLLPTALNLSSPEDLRRKVVYLSVQGHALS
jgi:hypothetical protein